jgi:hypothetical protein
LPEIDSMTQISKPRLITGWVLLCLVAAALVAAGSVGLIRKPSPEEEQMMKDKTPGMEKYGKLVCVVQIVSGLLIVIPRTSSLGILLATAIWGGAICTHVILDDLRGLPPSAILQAMTWIGAYLKDPRFLASFHPQQG